MSSAPDPDVKTPTPPVSAGLTPAAVSDQELIRSGTVRLLAKALPTTTCPHCACRAGEVEMTVRSAGRLRHPGRLVAFTALASVLVISLIAAFPLLLLQAWHDERSLSIKVRVCAACARRLRLGQTLTRYGYYVAGALPPLGLIGMAIVAFALGSVFSILWLLALELTLMAIAVVGVVAIRRERRRRLPFVLDFDGNAWRVELPAAWRTVLEQEAPHVEVDVVGDG